VKVEEDVVKEPSSTCDLPLLSQSLEEVDKEGGEEETSASEEDDV